VEDETRSIPTLASISKLLKCKELQNPEEAMPVEVPVEVPVKIKLARYSLSTPQLLGNYWE